MNNVKLCMTPGCTNLAYSGGHCAVHLPGVPKPHPSTGANISEKYHAAEVVLIKAGFRPVRLVEHGEVTSLNVYGDDIHDVYRVNDLLSQFDELYNFGINHNPNNSTITIC